MVFRKLPREAIGAYGSDSYNEFVDVCF